jgi:hypothetical protein
MLSKEKHAALSKPGARAVLAPERGSSAPAYETHVMALIPLGGAVIGEGRFVSTARLTPLESETNA